MCFLLITGFLYFVTKLGLAVVVLLQQNRADACGEVVESPIELLVDGVFHRPDDIAGHRVVFRGAKYANSSPATVDQGGNGQSQVVAIAGVAEEMVFVEGLRVPPEWARWHVAEQYRVLQRLHCLTPFFSRGAAHAAQFVRRYNISRCRCMDYSTKLVVLRDPAERDGRDARAPVHARRQTAPARRRARRRGADLRPRV